MNGNPLSHGGLGKGVNMAIGQGKGALSRGLDTWGGWVTPGGLGAPEGSQKGLVVLTSFP